MPAPAMPPPAPAPTFAPAAPVSAPPAYAPAPAQGAYPPAPPPSAPAPAPVAARSAPPPTRPRLDAPAPDLRRAEPQPAQPGPASAVDVSAAAIERLRPSIQRDRREPAMVAEEEGVPLSPNGGHGPSARRAPMEPPFEPRLGP